MLRLSLVVVFAVAGLAVRAEEVPNAIDKLLEQEVAKKHVAGGVYLVSKKGKIVLKGAVGMQDADARKPMAIDTLFRIASMTKPITSVGVMMLVDEGKVALTDPLAKYVPEFADTPVAVSRKDGDKVVWSTEKAKRPITIHDLLTHTSGISYRFINRPYLGELFVKENVSDGVSETEGTIADNTKRIAKVPLAFQPGTGYEYGLNTDVLGRVIEVASGKSLDEFFRERIFTPLKMNDTYFHVPKDKQPRLAALYTPAADGTIRNVGDKPVVRGLLVYSATFPTWEKSKYTSGGGGLVSTVNDYHRFLQMLLQGGELDGQRLLKATTVQQMTSNQIGKLGSSFGPHGDRFGYGFGVVTEKGGALPVGSYSWGGLFYTYFWVDPVNEVTAVLLTQMFPADRTKLREEFVSRTYATLHGLR